MDRPVKLGSGNRGVTGWYQSTCCLDAAVGSRDPWLVVLKWVVELKVCIWEAVPNTVPCSLLR